MRKTVTMTAKKGDLVGGILVKKDPRYGGNYTLKCPVYFGDYQGKRTDVLGVMECKECMSFKGVMLHKKELYILCEKARLGDTNIVSFDRGLKKLKFDVLVVKKDGGVK